jgi:hypothetical protein
MTTYGKNMKWTVASHHQEGIRRAFETGLGITREPGDRPVDVFPFPSDSWIAIQYVPSDHALTTEQLMQAPWLEFLVADVDGTAERLRKAGVRSIEYSDKDHPYFQFPGGPVFRLANGV